MTSTFPDPAGEEFPPLLSEASVTKTVDEGVDCAVDVVRADDDGVTVPPTVHKVVTPVDRVRPDVPG